MTGGYDRRSVLTGTAGVVGALAGCADRDGGETDREDRTERTDDGPGTGDTDETPTATDADAVPAEGALDLREANVVGVEVTKRGASSYRLDVTLYHDDAGEAGYANWWQVESLDGDRLGRRTLTHAHGTTRFTRSETVQIPEETTCVVVRGHDETHGYGGRAALVTLEGATTVEVDQGSDVEAFASGDCARVDSPDG